MSKPYVVDKCASKATTSGGQYTIVKFCVVRVDMMVEQGLVNLTADVHQSNMYHNICVGRSGR